MPPLENICSSHFAAHLPKNRFEPSPPHPCNNLLQIAIITKTRLVLFKDYIIRLTDFPIIRMKVRVRIRLHGRPGLTPPLEWMKNTVKKEESIFRNTRMPEVSFALDRTTPRRPGRRPCPSRHSIGVNVQALAESLRLALIKNSQGYTRILPINIFCIG